MKPALTAAQKAVLQAEARGVGHDMLASSKARAAVLKDLVDVCTLTKADAKTYPLPRGFAKLKDFSAQIAICNKAVGVLNLTKTGDDE